MWTRCWKPLCERLPAPEGDSDAPLQALIFDSWYDSYQGVVVMFRVMHGTIRKGDSIQMMATGKKYEVTRLGVFSPEAKDVDCFTAGDSGPFYALPSRNWATPKWAIP